MRAITAAKSTVPVVPVKPNAPALLICLAIVAERISALLGTQPKLRQSPPILCPSIRVTSALTAAAMYAETRPPAPAPMTTRLRSKRAGFFHLA